MSLFRNPLGNYSVMRLLFLILPSKRLMLVGSVSLIIILDVQMERKHSVNPSIRKNGHKPNVCSSNAVVLLHVKAMVLD